MKLLLASLTTMQILYALEMRSDAESPKRYKFRRIAHDAALQDATGKLAAASNNQERPGESIPWWKLPTTNNGEMNALTGQQFYPSDDDVSSSGNEAPNNPPKNPICPINRCHSSGVLNKHYCGEHARCLNGFCQCDFGWKPAGDTPVARGWSGLEALTVRVDVYTAGCTKRCKSLSCSEVSQLKGCFDRGISHSDSVQNGEQMQTDQNALATDGLHLGAVKAPAVDAGVGG